MGYPYQLKPDQRGQTALLIAMIPLAVINLVVILPRAVPWIREQAGLLQLLLAPLLCVGLFYLVLGESIVVLVVPVLLWQFVRSILDLGQTEADAAFAGAGPAQPRSPTPARWPGPYAVPDEPAAVMVECIPDRHWGMARGWFDVYVDDQPLWTVTGEPMTPLLVPAGRHRVFIKIMHMKSDEVEVDIDTGEICRLACGMTPIIRNPLFRVFEAKLRYVAIPVALVCFFIPVVGRFVAEHFGVEFLVILFLGFLGILSSLLRFFSRRAGAMVYLRECPDSAETD